MPNKTRKLHKKHRRRSGGSSKTWGQKEQKEWCEDLIKTLGMNLEKQKDGFVERKAQGKPGTSPRSQQYVYSKLLGNARNKAQKQLTKFDRAEDKEQRRIHYKYSPKEKFVSTSGEAYNTCIATINNIQKKWLGPAGFEGQGRFLRFLPSTTGLAISQETWLMTHEAGAAGPASKGEKALQLALKMCEKVPGFMKKGCVAKANAAAATAKSAAAKAGSHLNKAKAKIQNAIPPSVQEVHTAIKEGIEEGRVQAAVDARKGGKRKKRRTKRRRRRGGTGKKGYSHPKKGSKSRTRKGNKDFTTKRGNKVFHRKRHYVRKSRKPYRKRR